MINLSDLKPFDPADYLKSEVGIRAYLEDAALDGPKSVARAEVVVARARARIAAREADKNTAPSPRAARG